VDDLLRQEVFVNLNTVVRQGLRAGVATCSLKEVEALARFAREGGGDAYAKRSALWTVGGSSCRPSAPVSWVTLPATTIETEPTCG